MSFGVYNILKPGVKAKFEFLQDSGSFWILLKIQQKSRLFLELSWISFNLLLAYIGFHGNCSRCFSLVKVERKISSFWV